MAPTQTVHHHRNTTKVSHKPYKSKHASKNALKDQAKGMIVITLNSITFIVRQSNLPRQAKSRMSGALVKPPTNN